MNSKSILIGMFDSSFAALSRRCEALPAFRAVRADFHPPG